MNNTDKYKRGFARILTLLMILTALFVTGIPVRADTVDDTASAVVTSISEVTMTAEIKASSNTALKISWEKCPLAQGYVIYRRESTKKSFKRIKKVSASKTSYINKRLTSSKPYQYAVRAIRKENGKYVYSKFVPVTGATRPATVKSTIKPTSSSTMKVTWKKSSRADGYRIYRRPAGGKWVLVADVAKNLTSYSDTGVSASTKYVYTVRPYKKGGNVKYMSAIRLSNIKSTPAAQSSNSSNSNAVITNTKFTDAQKDVMKKILYAVETGGQVYGNQKYGDFTEAFTNSSTEYAITIGAGQWYGTEAQRLLKLIHETMGEDEWNKIDTGNHYVWKAVCTENWAKYKIPKSSWRARVIVKLLQTDVGIKCQDQLMYKQIEEYESEVRNLGVTDARAVGMFINIRHQGGYGAVTRVLSKTAKPVSLINVYKALASDSGGQVGTYKTRQAKVYQWLLTYMK